jgi:hypothetical protein
MLYVIPSTSVFEIFENLCEAIRLDVLIKRVGRDKEFHFQDWFEARLESSGINFDPAGRNSYPDFTLVDTPEGFEVKGLAYPGRVADFDCNSQVPVGVHNGRAVYYVFGRYPEKPDGDQYPVLDLVVCHGDLLNAMRDYTHKNKSVRAFGSYGDILLRDRKMYVAPTPFALQPELVHRRTLIVPVGAIPSSKVSRVGQIERQEVDNLLSSYSFDLLTNEFTTESVPNPSAGIVHSFDVYRSNGDADFSWGSA